jgi:hypothetical protein
MSDSLADVLEAGPWQRALFTTYSLSLTFFETIILRALRKAQCRDAWLVADAEGYRSSLMERGSKGVGYEYRLIPIGLQKGVFHGKSCYLVGGDGDLLIVGSGNLTFGGFGRNLEVFEVLSSHLHSKCFSDFADFLELLMLRDDVVCPDFAWANEFAHRARNVSSASSQISPHPKLMTSVVDPITKQLATEVNSCGTVVDMTVLSPFFDPDGRAVLELATETNATQVKIALPPSNEDTSFPFRRASKWPVRVSAVALDRKGEMRSLHAKWMEWKTSSGILTLTGSINATRQALSDINNIEIGVVRLAQVDSGWAVWKKAQIPSTYQPAKFVRSGIGSTYLVFAELLNTGDLRGRIVSFLSPSGSWSGGIQKPNGDSIEFVVTVKQDGCFKLHVTTEEEMLFATGLQIRLESSGRLARGWITNLTILNLPKTHPISPSSLLRLINREETTEDEIALLEYIAIHALEHIETFRRRAIPPTEVRDHGSEDNEFSIHLEKLRPNAKTTEPGIAFHDHFPAEDLAFERVIAQLRRRLLGHVSKRDRTVPPTFGGGNPEEEDEEAAEANSSANRSNSAFEYFMQSMEDLVASQALSDDNRRPVLVIWLEVALHMLVRRKRDRAEASGFLRTWLWLATSKTSVRQEVDSLEQHIVTSAAILSGIGLGSESSRLVLHEQLEHYWQGEVQADRAHEDLLPNSPLSISSLFLESSGMTLEESLEQILNTTTLRNELQKLLEGSDEVRQDSPLFRIDAARELREELLRRGDKARIEFLQNQLFLCPTQFIGLSEACKGELRMNRVARCSVCSRLILRTTP